MPGMVSMLKIPLEALLVAFGPAAGSGCQEEVRPAALSLAGTLDSAGCQYKSDVKPASWSMGPGMFTDQHSLISGCDAAS